MSVNTNNNIIKDTITSSIDDTFLNTESYMIITFIFACALTGITAGYLLMDMLIPSQEKNVENERSKLIRQYEKGYLDELGALDDNQLSNENLFALRNLNVEDETPFGKIIMTYNSDTESYWYFSDSKSVPYKTLDALARNFAVTHSCKCVCVNYREEWEKAKAKAKSFEAKPSEAKPSEAKPSETNETDDKAKPKQRDVFAKLKKYNNIDKQDNIESVNSNRKESIKRRKYKPVSEKANRFTHKGRLIDYVEPTKSELNIEPKQKLTFADFKANVNADANKKA